MNLSPELQKVLTDALIVVIPTLASLFGAFAAWATSRLLKNRKDNRAYHVAKRALEKELGIETEYCHKTGRLIVTRTTAHSGQVGSVDPQPLRQEGG